MKRQESGNDEAKRSDKAAEKEVNINDRTRKREISQKLSMNELSFTFVSEISGLKKYLHHQLNDSR
jgi:hypothetical protein